MAKSTAKTVTATKATTAKKAPTKAATGFPGMRPVIICTKHRGVFFGYIPKAFTLANNGTIVPAKGARMAIYYGTTRGVMELAETGPTDKSNIGAPGDGEFMDATALFEVTPAAEAVWAKVF